MMIKHVNVFHAYDGYQDLPMNDKYSMMPSARFGLFVSVFGNRDDNDILGLNTARRWDMQHQLTQPDREL